MRQQPSRKLKSVLLVHTNAQPFHRRFSLLSASLESINHMITSILQDRPQVQLYVASEPSKFLWIPDPTHLLHIVHLGGEDQFTARLVLQHVGQVIGAALGRALLPANVKNLSNH